MPSKKHTKDEIKNVLVLSRPCFKNGDKLDDDKVDAYASMLDGIHPEIVNHALKLVAREEEYFPSFASIFKQCRELVFKAKLKKAKAAVITPFEAWSDCLAWLHIDSRKFATNAFAEMTIRMMGKGWLRSIMESDLPYKEKDFRTLYDETVRRCRDEAIEEVLVDGEIDAKWDFAPVQKELSAYFAEKQKAAEENRKRRKESDAPRRKTDEERRRIREKVEALEAARKRKSVPSAS